jgi:hypothetical protein
MRTRSFVRAGTLAATLILFVGTAHAQEPDTVADVGSAVAAPVNGAYDWIKHPQRHDKIIRVDLHIDAPPDVVWKLVRDPSGYAKFNHALTASLDKVAVGQSIALAIRLMGDHLPPTNSEEQVVTVDDRARVIEWDRTYENGYKSRRPQLVEPEGSGSHYYTALELPPFLDDMVLMFMKASLEKAFTAFAVGLRDEAERQKATESPPAPATEAAPRTDPVPEKPAKEEGFVEALPH